MTCAAGFIWKTQIPHKSKIIAMFLKIIDLNETYLINKTLFYNVQLNVCALVFYPEIALQISSTRWKSCTEFGLYIF